jgi:hypothetical protein
MVHASTLWRRANPERAKELSQKYAKSEKGQAKVKEYREANKEKLHIKNKEWRKNNPERTAEIYRKQNLKQKYGMSLEDYDKMLQEQSNVCAVCEQPEVLVKKGKLQPLCVDHCHESGKVRALLCNDCNRNLIAHRTSSDIFYKAAAYVEKHKREKIG